MVGLWTNPSDQKPREVGEQPLAVVSKVRISQRSDCLLHVVQNTGHNLTRGAPTKHGTRVIFVFEVFHVSPWLL